MDDPTVAEAARITMLRDNWLIQIGRPTPQAKARLKKVAEAEKKEKARQDRAREKSQATDIRRVALANRQAEVSAFRDVLSDPLAPPEPEEPRPSDLPIVELTPVMTLALNTGRKALEQVRAKKHRLEAARLTNLRKSDARVPLTPIDLNQSPTRKRPRSPTPLPMQMEIIRAGSKRKVKVTARALENTPSKRMLPTINND